MNTTQIGNAEMERGLTNDTSRVALRGNGDNDRRRGIWRLREGLDVATKVFGGKDRVIVKVNDVGANDGITKGFEGASTDSASMNFGDESATEVRAVCDFEMKWTGGVRIERHGDLLKLRERMNINVQINREQGIAKIEDVGFSAGLHVVEEASVRGTIGKGKIRHSFVESNVLADFDTLGEFVKVKNIGKSLSKAKKETGTSIRVQFLRAAIGRTCGERIDAATKGAEMTKVRTATSTELEGGLSSFRMRSHIVETDKVMKSIGPELDRETSAVKHG